MIPGRRTHPVENPSDAANAPRPPARDKILIRGARQHNLKNINIDLPRNRLTVITGLSGSGKSTLAFDTLYAEGQRRYVESLSAYARQFLERMPKPDVDHIEGLSPAIAIDQKSAAHNPRSTVGTVTEIYDYLRLLYARAGRAACPRCGRPIQALTVDEMVDQVLRLPQGAHVAVMAAVAAEGEETGEAVLKRLRKEGFARVRIDGRIVPIEEAGPLPAGRPHRIEVVVDRLIVKPASRNRLADSLELALAQGRGAARVDVEGRTEIQFTEKAACVACGVSGSELTPASFSFNSPQGACPDCGGLGRVNEFDPRLIVPDPRLTLRQGAVAAGASRLAEVSLDFLEALAAHGEVSIHTPFRDLPERFKEVLLHGSGAEAVTYSIDRRTSRVHYRKPFAGIIPRLERRYRETDSARMREEIQRFMNSRLCPACGGARLNAASRAVKIADTDLPSLCAMTIAQAARFCAGLDFQGQAAPVARRLLAEILARLGFLERVGLPYLTLDRPAQTLSGGEGQRIRLATQIGSKLTGVLYVLDEPSVGLHPRDTRRLLDALLELRELGNTLVVVEHDEETIRQADYVVDMGPGAGSHGGRVVFAGTPEALSADPDSLTGKYLSGRLQIPSAGPRRRPSAAKLVLEGASANNLKNVTVAFPVGCFICVTGVSGSGKSSLVSETLAPALHQQLTGVPTACGPHRGISGSEHFDQVIHIDQAPIGRTPRSNPATYTGVFTPIRELLSRTPEARARGYKSGRFSFNVKGGRCEACEGDGTIRIEMHFLPDVYVVCDVCQGRRYNRETLEVAYKGRNIADILQLTVAQGLEFFGRIGAIREKLQSLADAGLGYMRIGQPATTLSGGEAQRVKLSRELCRRGGGRTLYVLDEPTTGLHADDIRRLLDVLRQLVEAGNTVIMIEHHLDVIRAADFVVDLGPGGGEAGGEILGCGTPEQIAALPGSFTGEYLRKTPRR
jgi:excinuclease ABC subunit A